MEKRDVGWENNYNSQHINSLGFSMKSFMLFLSCLLAFLA